MQTGPPIHCTFHKACLHPPPQHVFQVEALTNRENDGFTTLPMHFTCQDVPLYKNEVGLYVRVGSWLSVATSPVWC